MERLHDLLVRGAISQVEFDDLKAKLLGGASLR
ncbi:SHOCT domain-containing protein [Bradyrhizobium diazoefficiens]